jgi:class 3 adenylate cyclase
VAELKEADLTGERLDRRLSAILAADVAGYSRLMGLDEEGTVEQLKNYRVNLFDPKIIEHRGRIVRTTGDGMLAEFASAVDAARCAVDIQLSMAGANLNVAAAKRVELRIGIHVGDIISDDGDIFGDGVNIAARLESISEPGGICVSARVQEDVEGNTPCRCKRGPARQNGGRQQIFCPVADARSAVAHLESRRANLSSPAGRPCPVGGRIAPGRRAGVKEGRLNSPARTA